MSVLSWSDLRDAAAVGAFLRTHGPAPFNHLSDADIGEQSRRLAAGRLECTAALVDGEIVALTTVSRFSAVRLPGTSHLRLSGHYLEEVAVHAEHRGRGIGASLVREAVSRRRSADPADFYIDCDERNTPCAQMIRKAGFQQIASYLDADRGSAAGPRQTLLFRFQEGR